MSKIGIRRNIGRDGSTNQNVAVECNAKRSGSPVSVQSHIIPRTDTRGREAIKPPKPGNFLDTSETVATMIPDRSALIIRYSIMYL